MKATIALGLLLAGFTANAAASPNADDRLTQSACNGDVERVRQYLSAGDKPTDKSLFCSIVISNNPALADLLIANGANPNANYAYMNPLTGYTFHLTMLQFAVLGSRAQMIDVLLNRGADINFVFQAIATERVEYGTTALAFAAARGDGAMIQLLLTKKANINADRAAALFAVVTRPSLSAGDQLLKTLLTAGGNPRIRNSQQKTVCDYAVGIQLDSILAAGGCE